MTSSVKHQPTSHLIGCGNWASLLIFLEDRCHNLIHPIR
jgi:hypothetical protein